MIKLSHVYMYKYFDKNPNKSLYRSLAASAVVCKYMQVTDCTSSCCLHFAVLHLASLNNQCWGHHLFRRNSFLLNKPISGCSDL